MNKLKIEILIDPRYQRIYYTYKHKGVERIVASSIFDQDKIGSVISALISMADQLDKELDNVNK